MSACSTGCPTPGAHKTWGECLRAKNTRIGYCQSVKGHDYTRQKKWDAELARYRDARAQGVQPAGTTTAKINQALAISEATGKPYDAGKPLESLGVKLEGA